MNTPWVKILQDTYPDLKIANRRNRSSPEDEEAGVVEDVTASGPDIVWSGLDKSKEQVFAVKWRDTFKASWLVT